MLPFPMDMIFSIFQNTETLIYKELPKGQDPADTKHNIYVVFMLGGYVKIMILC